MQSRAEPALNGADTRRSYRWTGRSRCGLRGGRAAAFSWWEQWKPLRFDSAMSALSLLRHYRQSASPIRSPHRHCRDSDNHGKFFANLDRNQRHTTCL